MVDLYQGNSSNARIWRTFVGVKFVGKYGDYEGEFASSGEDIVSVILCIVGVEECK